MLQHFNPKRVLRQISNSLLKEFFERQGHPHEIDWDSISNTQVDSIFDDTGEFQRTPDRRAFKVVFAQDRGHGTLEVYAKGGRQVIEPLQQVYSNVILGETLDAEGPDVHPYHLDGLMDRSFAFPTDPEDGILDVSLRCMRLSILGRTRKRITLEPDPIKVGFILMRCWKRT